MAQENNREANIANAHSEPPKNYREIKIFDFQDKRELLDIQTAIIRATKKGPIALISIDTFLPHEADIRFNGPSSGSLECRIRVFRGVTSKNLRRDREGINIATQEDPDEIEKPKKFGTCTANETYFCLNSHDKPSARKRHETPNDIICHDRHIPKAGYIAGQHHMALAFTPTDNIDVDAWVNAQLEAYFVELEEIVLTFNKSKPKLALRAEVIKELTALAIAYTVKHQTIDVEV